MIPGFDWSLICSSQLLSSANQNFKWLVSTIASSSWMRHWERKLIWVATDLVKSLKILENCILMGSTSTYIWTLYSFSELKCEVLTISFVCPEAMASCSLQNGFPVIHFYTTALCYKLASAKTTKYYRTLWGFANCAQPKPLSENWKLSRGFKSGLSSLLIYSTTKIGGKLCKCWFFLLSFKRSYKFGLFIK